MGFGVEQALLLEDDLIAAYKQDEVQAKLKAFAEQAKSGDRRLALELKEAFLLDLQKPIVARHGFPASARGVEEAMREVSRSHICRDPDVARRLNHMERLLAADEPLDWYGNTALLWHIRNMGHFRQLPQDRFPIVEYEEQRLADDCRVEAVPRRGMLSPQDAEALAEACKRGDATTAAHLLGIRKIAASCPSVLVNLGYRGLGPGPTKTLAQALSQAASLEVLELDISGNNIGPEGAKALAASLPKALKVLKLNLANNRLTLAGVRAVAESIPQAVEVLHLGFAGMKMGPDGARALASGLPPRLVDLALDLSGNGVGDDGVVAISRALPKTIESLSVALLGNNLGRRGFYSMDRQIDDPLNEYHLPRLRNENFRKAGAVELTEFREEPDGRLVRQLDWRSNV